MVNRVLLRTGMSAHREGGVNGKAPHWPMKTLSPPIQATRPAKPARNYLTEGGTLKSWLLTTDHKRIGLLYLCSIIFFFLIAALAAALIRMELITPPGDMVTS